MRSKQKIADMLLWDCDDHLEKGVARISVDNEKYVRKYADIMK